jgi:phosphatidylserine decarboxylase
VSYISQFISYHDLDLDQVLDPINSFKTFNEFFYRKLKAGSRILASPSPTVAVCPADSRSNCFETVKSATDLWIKGTKFSVESLLDDKEQAEIFKDGSIAVFRLAPQDYHRFHIPVDGKVVSTKHIDGSYFTVNPMAVRASVDVFVENVRSVTMIDSVFHGRVAYVCIGAMLVGSIVITTQPGQEVKRMDEHGYFKFGGSTIVLLFESGKIAFDKDLVDNSNTSLETLVKMGNSLGAAQK